MINKYKTFYILVLLFITTLVEAQNCYHCGVGTGGDFHAIKDTQLISGTYNFKTFIIDKNVKVDVVGNDFLIINCSESVQIYGTLNATGGNGTAGIPGLKKGDGGVGVAGGMNGGNGNYSTIMILPGNDGFGIGKGGAGSLLSGGGGAGYATNGQSSHPTNGIGGKTYGNPEILTLVGGSGGGGGSSEINKGSGGGGAGGGVVLINCCKKITIGEHGVISTNGGKGGSDGNGNCGAGGGGSGGSIFIIAYQLNNKGLITAKGGLGGVSSLNTTASNGGNGSDGRVRIDCINKSIPGIIQPSIGYTIKPFNVQIFRSLGVSCNGKSDGYAKVRINNGVPPYSLVWSNGSTGDELSNLSAGVYSVTVTDKNGCSQITEVTIKEPLAITTTTHKIEPSCGSDPNGVVFLNTEGGNPFPFRSTLSTSFYSTDNARGIMFDVVVKQPIDLTKILLNLNSTQSANSVEVFYKIGSKSGNEFSANAWNYLGSFPTQLSARQDYEFLEFLSPLVLGEGTSAFYLYSKSAEINLLNINTLGNTTVFDHNILIQQGISRDQSNNPFNGNILENDQFISGGLEYQLKNPLNEKYNISLNKQSSFSRSEIKGLNSGLHEIEITDAMGCKQQTTFLLKNQSQATINAINLENISCEGTKDGSISIDAAPSDSVKVIGASFLGKQLVNGMMFNIDVKKKVELNRLLLTIVDTTNLTVYYKAGKFNGHQNMVSSWTPIYTGTLTPDPTQFNIVDLTNSITMNSGFYSIYVYSDKPVLSTNQSGFNTQLATSLQVDLLSGISLYNGNSPFALTKYTNSAYVGTLEFSATKESISYQWNDGSQNTIRTGLEKGTYSCVISENNGCDTTVTVKITEPNPIQTSSSVVNEIDSSSNGSITINANGGYPPYSYFWSSLQFQGPTISNISAGSYNVLVVDSKGCPFYETINVNRIFTPKPIITKLELYPNPTSDWVKLAKEITGMDNCEVRIFDKLGRLIREEKTTISRLLNTGINLSSYMDGIYTVAVFDNQQYLSTKVSVIK